MKTIVKSTICALFLLPVVSFADTMVLTVSGDHQIEADWKPAGGTCSGDQDMTFAAQNGSVTCASSFGGLNCQIFQLEAMVRDDFNSLYNQLATVNGNTWPIYDQIKAAGGSKTYNLVNSCSDFQANKAKLKNNTFGVIKMSPR